MARRRKSNQFFFAQIGPKLTQRFPSYFPKKDATDKERRYTYWLFKAVEKDSPETQNELNSAVNDLLSERAHYEWNESKTDYYPVKSQKEFDRLCFFVEKETGQSTEGMNLYKFLAILESLNETAPKDAQY